VSERIDILISAKNAASQAINQAGNDLTKLDKSAGKLASGLSGLSGLIGVAGFVALGGAAAAVGVQLAESGAQAMRLGESFKTLAAQAGESGTAMLESLRAASHGTIADSDLMLAANRALLLGVAQNSDQMGQLLTVAAARA